MYNHRSHHGAYLGVICSVVAEIYGNLWNGDVMEFSDDVTLELNSKLFRQLQPVIFDFEEKKRRREIAADFRISIRR